MDKFKVNGLDASRHPSGAYIVFNKASVRFTVIERGHGTQVIRYRDGKEPYTMLFSLGQEEWLFKYLREAR